MNFFFLENLQQNEKNLVLVVVVVAEVVIKQNKNIIIIIFKIVWHMRCACMCVSLMIITIFTYLLTYLVILMSYDHQITWIYKDIDGNIIVVYIEIFQCSMFIVHTHTHRNLRNIIFRQSILFVLFCYLEIFHDFIMMIFIW